MKACQTYSGKIFKSATCDETLILPMKENRSYFEIIARKMLSEACVESKSNIRLMFHQQHDLQKIKY